ncbi:MAG: FUSC family protein [Candidatus Competibacteraceae bacterium]|nr:FUSC family protein [Candidatus Competibacteraceae bacterium]
MIAVGLSLALAWDEPKWAMFAVIYCALGNEGESFHKGLMRILATFMGGGLSLVFMALFNEHRWAFGAAVACWIFLCSYMMQDNRRYYVWFVGGWLTILMPIYSSENSALAFEIVMLRLEETLLGVLVYTFVANVLLIDHQRRNFMHKLRDQIENLKQVLSDLHVAYREGSAAANEKNRLDRSRQALALQTDFHNRIDAGIIESFDIINNRDAWRRTIDEFTALVNLMNSLSIDLQTFNSQYLLKALPDIRPVLLEIERRLDQSVAILDGAQTVEPPRKAPLPSIDQIDASGDVFDHGAVLISLETLADIDQHSANLLLAVAEARGIVVEGAYSHRDVDVKRAPTRSIIPDPEKIALALRTTLTFWLAFAIYIFVPDFPNGTSAILLSTIYGMFLAMKPTTYLPAVEALGSVTIVIAGIMHMIIMPQLSSYLGLGIMLYVYMFIGAWLFHQPEHAPVRFIVLGFVAMALQIANDQAYSFYYTANLLIVYQVPFILLWLTRSAPVSFRPEAAFQRLLRRYMASFRYLIEDIRHDQRASGSRWWRRQWRAYHLRNLMRIPDKMATWVSVMPEAAMNGEEKKQGQALCLSLYALTTGMMDLHRLGRVSDSLDMIERMYPTTHAWRVALENLAENFHDAPDALPTANGLTARLHTYLMQVRSDVRDTLNRGAEAANSCTAKALLRELSAYRSLSETLISATQQASALHWERLRESRF